MKCLALKTLKMNPPGTTVKIFTGICCAILALVLSLYIVPVPWAIQLVQYLGAWGMLITFLLFLYALRRPLNQWTRSDVSSTLRAHLPAVLTILAATLYLHLHVDRGFKILFDEHAISSTAMSMHLDQQAYVQAAAHIIDGEAINSAGFVDKRPIFFPFSISLIHRISGFRPENVFWLNSGLTCLLLSLLYCITRQVCGKRNGILAVLLLTSLPLLAQNTTGGGYEIMNLCLIASLLLCGFHYMRSPGVQGLNLLILVSILLANNRYESIVYVTVPVLLLLLKSLRAKRIELTWFSVLSPILLILPLLSYAVFQADSRFFQTTKENFLGSEHLPLNLKHAASYLFNLTGNYSNSVLLSTAGTLSLLALSITLLRRLPQLIKKDVYLTASIAVLLVVILNTMLALSSFWGKWTDPMTSRFSLPLQFFFALAAPFAAHYCLQLKNPPRWMLLLSLLFIPCITSPHSIRLNNEARLLTAEGNEWAIDWVSNHTGNTNNFIIADASIGFALYRHSAFSIIEANKRPGDVQRIKELNLYDNILFVESFYYDSEAKRRTGAGVTAVNPCFILQTVAQHNLHSNAFFRISRLVGLHPKTPNLATNEAKLPQSTDHENSGADPREVRTLAPTRE
jgi:hypothetical protein